MSGQPCSSATTVFSITIMLVIMGACTSSPETTPSNSISQKTNNLQPVTETSVNKTSSAQSSGDLIIFKGICDGSAAVKLAGETILVAYDEENTLFAFAMSGGLPTASIDLTTMLKLDTSDEMDIEAATVAGDRIWWIGSHSLDSKGDYAANRHMLFATNIPSPDLSDVKVVTKPVDITEIVLKSLTEKKILTAGARNRFAKNGGINIEGLAASADGGLHVGFRSPLSGLTGTSGNALVVSLLPTGGMFEVQKVSQLDLGDRGIRDIINNGSGFMIIAGPVSSGGEFSIYAWNGFTPPQQIKRLDELNAEGILDFGDHWLILSDDGKMKRMLNEAKDRDWKCDRIRRKNRYGDTHPGVFFRAKLIQK
jgi:hypothetical protein